MSTRACPSPSKACQKTGQEVRGSAARVVAFSALSLILILALGVGTAAGQEPPNEGPGPDPTRKLIAKRSLTLNTRGPDGNPVGKQVLPLALFIFHHLAAHICGWRQSSVSASRFIALCSASTRRPATSRSGARPESLPSTHATAMNPPSQII